MSMDAPHDNDRRQDCPCPAECPRHGRCEECREFHHASGGLTYCEQFAKRNSPDDSGPRTGREFRLMDYGACAG